MSPQPDPAVQGQNSPRAQQFVEAARERPPGLVREFCEFLWSNKKWWLAPIIVIALIEAGLAILTLTPAAPFIYSLF